MKKNKMMVLMVIILTLMGSLNLVRADQAGSESEFKGESQVQLDWIGTNGATVATCATTFWFFGGGCWDNWTVEKKQNVGVDSDVVVKTWGEGKVLVIYSLNSAEGCAGIEKTFVGYQTAYQTFDLYARSVGQTDVDPTTAKPDAELTIEKNSAELGLFRPIVATTPADTNGNICGWNIGTDVALKFALDN
jgi:hypothetical protein